MKFLSSGLVLFLVLMLFPATTTTAQDGGAQVQEFYSLVSPDNEYVYFDLFGIQAGTTIYVYGQSDEFDTLIGICDIDCEEQFIDNDDISENNINSALSYTFEADGDYSIFVTDCCSSDVTGIFRLLIGFNAPDVLDGNAFPTGAQIAVPYEPTYTDLTTTTVAGEAQIQQFYGQVNPDTEFVYYDIFGAPAGETLYLYAESGEIDTYLAVCDIECIEIFAENDDISPDNFNSALEFTFPTDGDYSILVTDCCDSEVTGTFRILLGYDAPQVLTGDASPTGASIAQEYEPTRVTAGTAERTDAVACADVELTERPQLSGPEFIAETDNFLVHYTLQGEDATTEELVQEVVASLEDILDIETNQFGWPSPPRDCGEGGDDRFDFYMKEILTADQVLGFAQPGNVVGDNPNSDHNETWAAYSFMVLDNDFRGVESPMSVMRATVAHELHHSIQFGYDVSDVFNWYYEATSSWIEIQTSPLDEDATGYTEAVFLAPDLCIGTLNEDTGVRIYGEWLLIDSLAQDYGPEAIKRLWEYVADFEGMDDYYGLLEELGTTPQVVLERYAIRNLLRDYLLGDVFPGSVFVEGAINGVGIVTPRRSGVQEMSVDYVLVRQKGNYTFSIDRPNLSLVVVGINRQSGQAQIFELGQSGTVDTTAFSNAYVIVLNNDQHNDPSLCNTTDWSLSVTDGTGTTPAEPLGESFSAERFVPAG